MSAFERMLCGLLRQATPESVAPHSFLNYHAPGLDYLCLHRTDGLTVKIYMTDPERLETCGNRDYLVNPHDHGYAFDTTVIAGQVTNVLFYASESSNPPHGRRHVEFGYKWAGRSFSRKGARSLHERREVYSAGSSYAMTADQIHTIVVPFHDQTCLALVQYQDEPGKEFTRFFARKEEPPEITGGMYIRPGLHLAEGLIRRAERFL